MKNNTSERLRKMIVTAMFCALAYMAMFLFHFKVSFLTFDMKDAILTILTLLYGPVSGICSVIIVALLEFITISDTGWYGLVMNVLSSGAFVLAAGLMYKFKRNFSGAVLAMIAAVLTMTGVMLLANCIITPLYMQAMGMGLEDITKMIPTLLLPFNVCKGVMNAAAVLVLYKPLVSALRRTGLVHSAAPAHYSGKRTVMLTAVAVLLMVATISILIFVLGGTVEWM